LCLLAVTLVTAPKPAWAEDTLMPSIVHEGCAEYLKGKPFEIIARFEDDSQLFDPKLYYHTSGESHWKQLPFTKMAKGVNFHALVNVNELKGTLEYFIEVFDEYGNGPARMGSPEDPIRVDPSKAPDPCDQVPENRPTPVPTPEEQPPAIEEIQVIPESVVLPPPVAPPLNQPVPPPAETTCERRDRPIYCETWLWATAATVLAVGGGLGLYLLLSGDDPKPTPRSDSVVLHVTGPDPTALGSNP